MLFSKKVTVGLATAAVVATVLFAQGPAFAVTAVTNGGFEVDAANSTTITGWTTVNTRINLGVDSLGGCVTQDTTDYAALGDFATRAAMWHTNNPSDPVPDPVALADNSANAFTNGTYDARTVATGVSGLTPFDGSGKMVALSSSMSPDGGGGVGAGISNGYVLHGPAIVSDSFTVGAGRSITLQWKAQSNSDDYAVLGYLLKDDCTQTEVIDATGTTSSWTTTTVPITTAGNYRFVFVGGTYDRTWGTVAGSYFYVDNILDVVNLGANPAVNISIDPTVGATILGIPATLTGAHLKANSSFTLKRDGVTIYTGTTDGSGNFTALANLPNNCLAGDQKFTLEAIDTNNVAVTSAYSLLADAGCLALPAVASEGPTLAATGINPLGLWVAMSLLMTGAALMVMRRIQTKKSEG